MQEQFVSTAAAAEYLGINRRFLLSLARRGIAGAYPIGTGEIRHTWVFKLSELGIAIDHRHSRSFSPPKPQPAPEIRLRKPEQRKRGQGYDPTR